MADTELLRTVGAILQAQGRIEAKVDAHHQATSSSFAELRGELRAKDKVVHRELSELDNRVRANERHKWLWQGGSGVIAFLVSIITGKAI